MNDDILDSRDLENRLAELDEEFEGWQSEKKKEDNLWEDEDLLKVWENEFEEGEEHKAINNLKECVDGMQWNDGITFIHENHFENYAREYAEDCGYIKEDVGWPYSCIDWEKAARELKSDYACITFRGEIYYYQA